jgi:hopanoid biosynthesis associated protein HpnK
VRRLIINADDLGLTPGVNRAVAEAASEGVVTSTTLMANGPAFADALARLRNPRLSVGCHVVLVDGQPLLARERVSTLMASRASNDFRRGFAGLALAALRGRLDPAQLEAEAAAQMQKIHAAGVRLSHFDTHKHVHLLPAVLRPVLRAARQCGVRAVRNPFAPIKPLAFAHLARRPHLWTRYTEVKILRGWAAAFRRIVQDEGLVTTDGTFGIVTTGALDLALFRAIIASIPEGTWEFVCHPGYNDGDLAGVRTRLRASRERELQVLTCCAARELLQQHGIELISYGDLR